MEQNGPERAKAAGQLDRRRQLTGQLAAGIAHDFNNLLATVLGSLELMDGRVERLPEGERERFKALIQRSIDAIQRAGAMTAGLLAFARREPSIPAHVNVNQLTSDLLALAAGSMGRRVRIMTDLARDLPFVIADPVRLETVLLHLLLKARQAMPNGGRLTITTRSEAGGVWIVIRHDGSETDFAEDDLENLAGELPAVLRVVGCDASLRLNAVKS